jgi:hypothetical protein
MAVSSMLPSVRGSSSSDRGVMTGTIIFHLSSAIAESIADMCMYMYGLDFGVFNILRFWPAFNMTAVLEGNGNDKHEAVDSES